MLFNFSYADIQRFTVDGRLDVDFLNQKFLSAKIIAPNTEEEFLSLNQIAVSLNEVVETENTPSSTATEAPRTLESIIHDLQRSSVKSSRSLISEAQQIIAATSDPRNLLSLAVATGNNKLVSRLIKFGYDVNAKDLGGNTPLHIAALNNLPDITLKLIENGADLSAVNAQEQTALELSALSGDSHLQTVKILSEARVNIEVADKIFKQMTAEATTSEVGKIIKKMKDSGTVNARFMEKLFLEETNPKQIELIVRNLASTDYATEILTRANEKNSDLIIAAMINSGLSFSISRQELMQRAITLQHPASVNALLGQDFDVGGLNAIGLALPSGNISILNSLVSAGAEIPADLNLTQAQELLRRSMAENQLELACALIKLDGVVVQKGMLSEVVTKKSAPLVNVITHKSDSIHQLLNR